MLVYTPHALTNRSTHCLLRCYLKAVNVKTRQPVALPRLSQLCILLIYKHFSESKI